MSNHQNDLPRHRSQQSGKRCETHLSEPLDELEASITITITDPAALVAMARKAPVLAAREAQIAMRTLDMGFREHRVGIIGAAYASAYHMHRTDRAWQNFIKDQGWDDLSNRPKDTLRARNHMLLHVLRYVFRAEGNKARRRVRVYAGMLQDRFYKGLKPEEVIPLIVRRGIEDLRKEGVELRRAGARKSFVDDLNAICDEDAEPITKLPHLRQRKMTLAQIDECRAALSTFNVKVAYFLEECAAQATPTRAGGRTEHSRGQSGDRQAGSAWRRR